MIVRTLRILCACAGILTCWPVVAAETRETATMRGERPVSDSELSACTGKLLLDNGISIVMSVVSDIEINGQLVLRTNYNVDQGPPTLAVYGSVGGAVSSGSLNSVRPAAGSGSPTNASIRNAASQPVTDYVGPTASAMADARDASALSELPIVSGGPGVVTANGAVSVKTVNAGTMVIYQGNALTVSQLLGQTLGIAISNSGNNRAIDTSSSVSIQISNVNPLALGSATAQILAMNAAVARGLLH